MKMSHILLSAIAVTVATIGIWYGYTAYTQEPAVRVVNVLSPELYNDAHIPGSINVPMEQLSNKLREWSPETTLVFYCTNYMCTSSKEAAKMFRDHGFPKSYAYEGGTAEWYQLSQKDPSYSISGPVTQQVWSIEMDPVTPENGEEDLIITAKELQKLLKNDILPSNR